MTRREKVKRTRGRSRKEQERCREGDGEDDKVKLCCHGNRDGSEEQNKNVNWFSLKECDEKEEAGRLCLMEQQTKRHNEEGKRGR